MDGNLAWEIYSRDTGGTGNSEPSSAEAHVSGPISTNISGEMLNYMRPEFKSHVYKLESC